MYLCIDIGGTKTLVALFTKGSHKLYSKRFLTAKDPEQFLRDLQRALKRFPIKHLQGVTIAVPGAIHLTGIKYGNLPWDHFPLKKRLPDLFPANTPIHIINDADAATIYEAQHFPSQKVVYLTFSTGVGGGLAENGQLLKKSSSFEPGHKKYPFKGRTSEWEDLAAASAIRQVYGAPVSTLKDQAIFNDVAVRLSLGLTDIIKTHQPDVVILGGPLAHQLPRFARPLRRLLAESLPQDCTIPRLYRARRPTGSVIYGLALYGKSRSDDN
jgi:predicted NBD/HSP70 family sugar kinase